MHLEDVAKAGDGEHLLDHATDIGKADLPASALEPLGRGQKRP